MALTIMMIDKKRASGSTYCTAFGFLVIFNMINTNQYGMYPPSYLAAAAFTIGIVMVMGTVWAHVWDPGEKKRINVAYKFEHMKKEIAMKNSIIMPAASNNPFSRPTASV